MKTSLLLLCLIAGVQEAISCFCETMSNERKFCDSDYVLKVRVLGKLKNPNRKQDHDDYYNIRVIKQYKAPEGVSLMHEYHVYTGTHSGLCGIRDLKRHKKYIISGKWSQSRLNLNMCSSIASKFPNRRDRSIKKLLKNPPNCELLPEYHGLYGY